MKVFWHGKGSNYYSYEKMFRCEIPGWYFRYFTSSCPKNCHFQFHGLLDQKWKVSWFENVRIIMSKEIKWNQPLAYNKSKIYIFWCKEHVLIQITWSNCTVEPIITRITIDCLELFIQKPKISSNQTITLCSYKHWIRNATKLFVWITPTDVISFIPPLVTSALHKITVKMGYLKSTQHYSNEETTLRHTFLRSDLHCLLLLAIPESFSRISLWLVENHLFLRSCVASSNQLLNMTYQLYFDLFLVLSDLVPRAGSRLKFLACVALGSS